MTISLHPASCAGIPNISTVEKSGADPPGMYRPTFSIGLLSRQHLTPFMVLMTLGFSICVE